MTLITDIRNMTESTQCPKFAYSVFMVEIYKKTIKPKKTKKLKTCCKKPRYFPALAYSGYPQCTL